MPKFESFIYISDPVAIDCSPKLIALSSDPFIEIFSKIMLAPETSIASLPILKKDRLKIKLNRV